MHNFENKKKTSERKDNSLKVLQFTNKSLLKTFKIHTHICDDPDLLKCCTQTSILSLWILLRVIASETKLKAFAFSNQLKVNSFKQIFKNTQSKRFKHCDKILDYMEVLFT